MKVVFFFEIEFCYFDRSLAVLRCQDKIFTCNTHEILRRCSNIEG